MSMHTSKYIHPYTHAHTHTLYMPTSTHTHAYTNMRARMHAPASSMAKQPPHTEAMELEPLLSVMVLSTRTVYGNTSWGGMMGSSARSASSPCPSSRRPACGAVSREGVGVR